MVIITREDKNLNIPRGLGNFVTEGTGGGVSPEEAREIAEEVVTDALVDYVDETQLSDTLADYATTAETANNSEDIAELSGATMAIEQSIDGFATTADTKAIQDSLENYATTADTKAIQDSLGDFATTADTKAIQDSLADYATTADTAAIQQSLVDYATTAETQAIRDDLADYATTADTAAIQQSLGDYATTAVTDAISGAVTSLTQTVAGKQDTLAASSGISIDNGVVSVKAGEGLGFSGDSLTIKTGEGLVYDENGNLTVAGGDGTMLSPADFSEGDPDGENGSVVTRGYDGQYQVYVLNDEVPEDPNDGQRKVVLYDDDALSEGVEIGVGGDFGRWQTAEVIYDSLYIHFMMIADIEEGSLTNQRFKFYFDGYDPEENNLVVKDYDDNELSWEYLTEIEANQGNEKSGIYLRDGLKEGYVPMDSRIFYDLDAMLADGSVEYFLADIFGGRLDWDRVYVYYTTETLESQKERRLYKIRNVQNEVWISSNESSRAYDSIVVDSWYINPDGGMNQLSKTVVQNQSIPTVPSPSFTRFGNDERGYLTYDADNGYFLYDNGTIETGVTSAYSQDLVDYLFTDALRSGGLIFGYLLPINQNNFYVIKNGETKLYCHPALSFKDLASSVTIDDTEFSKEVTYKYADWELTMWYAEGNKGANLRITAL